MSHSDQSGPETRSIDLQVEVPAPPEEVWETLTTGDGLRNWFPLDARVEPGRGGSVWLSWGPGSEGQAPIHVWEPNRRFGWTESHGEDPSGRPIKVSVDFHVEGRAGTTVVRLVQSGIGASADWDEMYDALKDGWTYFLFNLAHYFRCHRGRSRRLLWRRVPTDLARDEVWQRLLAVGLAAAGAPADGEPVELVLESGTRAIVESVRPGRHFTARMPELDDSLLFVEIEGRHVGFWLSTYGMDEARAESLDGALGARIEEALGAP